MKPWDEIQTWERVAGWYIEPATETKYCYIGDSVRLGARVRLGDDVRQWYHIIGGRSADYAAEQAEKEAKRLEKERRRLCRDYYGDDPLERRLRSHQR